MDSLQESGPVPFAIEHWGDDCMRLACADLHTKYKNARISLDGGLLANTCLLADVWSSWFFNRCLVASPSVTSKHTWHYYEFLSICAYCLCKFHDTTCLILRPKSCKYRLCLVRPMRKSLAAMTGNASFLLCMISTTQMYSKKIILVRALHLVFPINVFNSLFLTFQYNFSKQLTSNICGSIANYLLWWPCDSLQTDIVLNSLVQLVLRMAVRSLGRSACSRRHHNERSRLNNT